MVTTSAQTVAWGAVGRPRITHPAGPGATSKYVALGGPPFRPLHNN